jgi:hypothetical protein
LQRLATGRYPDWIDRRRLLPPGSIEPYIPTLAAKPPFGPGWVHEIKDDGYRLMVRRDGEAVPPFTAAAPVTPFCKRRRDTPTSRMTPRQAA